MLKLSQENKITSDQNNIVVEFSEGNIILDFCINSHDGQVVRIEFIYETSQEKAQSTNANKKKNINNSHVQLCQSSEVITHATTKSMGIQVTSKFKPWEGCVLGKAQKGRVCKKAVALSKILDERLLFDISLPFTPTFGGKKHWLLVIDVSTNCGRGLFLKEKSNSASVMISLIKNLKTKYNIQVQYLCCAFQKNLQTRRDGKKYQFTTLGTPQQQSCVEQKFATLFNPVHAMLNGGKFTAFLRNSSWTEATNTAMLLESNLFTLNRNICLFQHFLGKGRESSCLSCKKLVKCESQPTRITPIGLSQPTKLLLVCGQDSQKLILLVHTGYLTIRTKELFSPKI